MRQTSETECDRTWSGPLGPDEMIDDDCEEARPDQGGPDYGCRVVMVAPFLAS